MKIVLEFDSQAEYEEFIERNNVKVIKITTESPLTEIQEAMNREWGGKQTEIRIKAPQQPPDNGLAWDWARGLYALPKLKPIDKYVLLRTI